MIETVDDIKTIANVGTGTMGHAITLQFALAGYPVHLVGRGEASLEKAMKAIRSDAEDFAEAGLLKDGDTLDAVLARITGYADYASGVADVTSSSNPWPRTLTSRSPSGPKWSTPPPRTRFCPRTPPA